MIREQDILSCAGGQVGFRYRDARSGKMERRTVSGAQFLWLVLQHVLPKGFRRAQLWLSASQQQAPDCLAARPAEVRTHSEAVKNWKTLSQYLVIPANAGIQYFQAIDLYETSGCALDSRLRGNDVLIGVRIFSQPLRWC